MIFLVFQYFKNLSFILVINHVYFFYIVLYLVVTKGDKLKKPDVLRAQEVTKRNTLPLMTRQLIANYIKNAVDSFTKMEKTKKGIQENLFSAIMKTLYQKIVHVEQEVVTPVKKGFTFYSYGISKGK